MALFTYKQLFSCKHNTHIGVNGESITTAIDCTLDLLFRCQVAITVSFTLGILKYSPLYLDYVPFLVQIH